jgi:hypothetical protein
MKKSLTYLSAFALIATLSLVVFAAITIDDEGVGFVGKGDVQLAFGWNNAQLQSNADEVDFAFNSETTVVSEVSWTCTNTNNENTQIRERTTTTSSISSGLLDAPARVRNQITGFNLNGFKEGTTTTSGGTTTEGPALNSCPSGPWTLTTPAGAPTIISDTSIRQLTMSYNGTVVTVDLD